MDRLDFDMRALGIGLAFVFGSLLFVWFVVCIIRMFIFKKANRSSWAAFVPIYSSYVLCDIATGIQWLSICFALSGYICAALGTMREYIYLWSLICLAMGIILNVNLAKRFGKGVGFAIGLIILPVIFYPILAFGKSKYIPIDQEQTRTQNNSSDIDNYGQEQEISFSSNDKNDETEN